MMSAQSWPLVNGYVGSQGLSGSVFSMNIVEYMLVGVREEVVALSVANRRALKK